MLKSPSYRSYVAFLLVCILALAVALPVLADDISISVDAIAEIMPLNVGTNGTTQLYVVPRGGDGKEGCNLTGKTTLVVSVASSENTVATVSLNNNTFTSCGDTPTITIVPVAHGKTTISVAQVSNNTGATFNFAPATFEVNVTSPAPANTAPTIAVTGVAGGVSYPKGSVPAATCEVTDAEDGTSSFPATLSDITGPYTSDGIGEQTASCSYTDKGSPGLTVSASEIYGIGDPTVPSISYVLSPATPDGLLDWYKSNVSLTWIVTENESPNSLAKIGCQDQNITADQAATTYSCEATSAGGSAVPVSVSIKRDATAPTDIVFSSVDNYNFGGTPNPSASCTANGNISGLASCVVTGYDATLVGSYNATGTATDNAGNSSTALAPYTVIDPTPPVITPNIAGTLGNNGWYISNVTVSWTVVDNESTITSPACVDTLINTDTAGQTVSCTATSAGGPATNSVTIKRDVTAPSVSLVGGPANGASYYPAFLPSAPTCSASDATPGSGLVGAAPSCTVSGYSNTVGPHTVTASATDQAGHSALASASYTVLQPWTLNGFYQPVDMNNVVNTVKGGSTVPFKFEIFKGAVESTATDDVKPLVHARIACDLSAPQADIETVATGGTSLRYDTTAGQFIYNWKTPTGAGTCYRVTMTTLDGSSIVAFFKLK